MLDTRRRRRRLCFYEHPSYTSTSVALPPRCNFHGCGDRGLRHDSSSTTTPTKSEMLCCCWRYESPKTQHTTRHTRHNSTVSTFHYSTLTQIPPNIANSRQCVCMSASECLSACVPQDLLLPQCDMPTIGQNREENTQADSQSIDRKVNFMLLITTVAVKPIWLF